MGIFFKLFFVKLVPQVQSDLVTSAAEAATSGDFKACRNEGRAWCQTALEWVDAERRKAAPKAKKKHREKSKRRFAPWTPCSGFTVGLAWSIGASQPIRRTGGHPCRGQSCQWPQTKAQMACVLATSFATTRVST